MGLTFCQVDPRMSRMIVKPFSRTSSLKHVSEQVSGVGKFQHKANIVITILHHNIQARQEQTSSLKHNNIQASGYSLTFRFTESLKFADHHHWTGQHTKVRCTECSKSELWIQVSDQWRTKHAYEVLEGKAWGVKSLSFSSAKVLMSQKGHNFVNMQELSNLLRIYRYWGS